MAKENTKRQKNENKRISKRRKNQTQEKNTQTHTERGRERERKKISRGMREIEEKWVLNYFMTLFANSILRYYEHIYGLWKQDGNGLRGLEERNDDDDDGNAV